MAYCNFVRIRHGSVVGVYTVKLKTGVGGDERDMLTLAIQHVVEHIAGTLAREVVVPFLPSTTLLFDGVTFTVPKRGEKLELSNSRRRAPVSIAPSSSRTWKSRIPNDIPSG